MARIPDLATLRAGLWAERSLRRARRRLRRRPVDEVRLEPPPALPPEALRGVAAILRRRAPSCLERSLVLQRWHAVHGEPRDVVIGVTRPGDFHAHAWLDGEPAGVAFREITRVHP